MPLSDMEQAVIIVVSYVLLAVGVIPVPTGLPANVDIAVRMFLVMAGVMGASIKEMLGANPPSTVTGLTDMEQAIMTAISSFLIGMGALTAYLGTNPYISLVIAIIGAVGFGIKEALGTKVTPAPAPTK